MVRVREREGGVIEVTYRFYGRWLYWFVNVLILVGVVVSVFLSWFGVVELKSISRIITILAVYGIGVLACGSDPVFRRVTILPGRGRIVDQTRYLFRQTLEEYAFSDLPSVMFLDHRPRGHLFRERGLMLSGVGRDGSARGLFLPGLRWKRVSRVFGVAWPELSDKVVEDR